MTWNDLKKKVHVSIPFRMLAGSYLSRFMDARINPEISFDATTMESHSRSEFVHVSEQLQSHDLAVTLHFPFMDLSPGSPDPGVRDLTRRRFQELLPLLSVFKPKAVVCHAGFESRRYGFIRQIWTRNSIATWSPLAESIRNEGGVLMLENVFEDSPDDIREVFEEIGDLGVKFCLDTGHGMAFSSTPLTEWIGGLAPFLGQVHLHDNRGVQDDHLALGQGIIDFERFLRRLREVLQIPPLVTLEPHREEDLLPSLRCLQEMWPW
ncbi:MAG: sugar phosphate isomerase/epimerase [Deltaproteobacteria bacterium]|nr:sugar phosphate isomerase/epimerase [Deltaproteobacteria bacterium]